MSKDGANVGFEIDGQYELVEAKKACDYYEKTGEADQLYFYSKALFFLGNAYYNDSQYEECINTRSL